MSAPTLTAPVTATLVLPEGTPREQWLAARQHGIGGSDIAGILGLSRWSSPYQVWLDKTGRAAAEGETWPMFRGTHDEPKLRAWFTRVKGIGVTTTGMWRSVEHPIAFANPDGFTDDDGGLECKSHSWRMGDEWDEDQVSDAAELQSQWYMGVTGRRHWWVIAQLGDDEPVIRRVEFDPDLFANLVEAAEKFWTEHVIADVAPSLVARDLDAVKARFSVVDTPAVEGPAELPDLIAAWESAKAVAKEAEQGVELAAARLRNVMGGAEALTVDGVIRLTAKANGTFASTRFAAENPDVAAALMKTAEVLDIDALKRTHPDLYERYRARVMRPVKIKEK